MMAVGDIQRRDLCKRVDERIAVVTAEAPQRVPNAVGCLDIEQRAALRSLGHDRVDRRLSAVHHEHRAGLSAEREHMTRAVVFLVAPCPLVLLDDAAVVLVERKAGGHAGLLVHAVAQAIQVHTRLVFDDEHRLFQRFEVPDGARVHFVGVWIGVRWQLELGARYAQKAQRVVTGLRACLLGRDHVVGNGRHPGGVLRVRT